MDKVELRAGGSWSVQQAIAGYSESLYGGFT